jgi:hypothetical protein
MNDSIPITWLVHAVLAVLLIEAAVLAVLHRRNGRGLAPRDWVAMLLAGAGLAVALSLALHGAAVAWVAAALAAAGLAHLADLASRLRRVKDEMATERTA